MIANRLVSAAVAGQPARNFTSDNAGNITLDDRGSGNTVTIVIGADGRPQTVTVVGTGATSVAYKHNAFGERVSRIEGAATTHFYYDLNGTMIAESDGAGVVIREYLWLGTKPLGLVVGPAGSPTLYFVHADHLERVQKITDGSKAIAWDGQFTPYGRTHAITGTVTNPLHFPGQWADPAANYFYNYMRDYDATLARYLSVDPLGTGGGRNKFSYAGANPQNLVDPSGEQQQSVRPGTAQSVGRASGRLVINNYVLNPNYYSGMRVLQQIQQYKPNYTSLQPAPEQWTGKQVENLRLTLEAIRRELGPNPFACWPQQSPRYNQPSLPQGDPPFRLSGTVESHTSQRPYNNSPLTIREIMSTGSGVTDPQGTPGALRWDVPGTFRGSQGTWQLVVKGNQILHFNFVRKK